MPARAFDQPGDVCDDELAAIRGLDRAEHRRERRERILGDLRPRVRDPCQERRLAGVRQADEGRIREQLQPQLDHALVAGHADLGVARRLTSRRCEALVAPTAGAALCDDDPRAGVCEIGDQPVVRIEHLRADRYLEHDVGAALAGREAAAAGSATARLHLLFRAEAGEVSALRIRDEDHVAAVAAVTAVGPTLRHELLPAEVDAAVTAADRRSPSAWRDRGTSAHCRLGTRRLGRARRVGAVDDRDEAALAARPKATTPCASRIVSSLPMPVPGLAETRAALADEDHAS